MPLASDVLVTGLVVYEVVWKVGVVDDGIYGDDNHAYMCARIARMAPLSTPAGVPTGRRTNSDFSSDPLPDGLPNPRPLPRADHISSCRIQAWMCFAGVRAQI